MGVAKNLPDWLKPIALAGLQTLKAGTDAGTALGNGIFLGHGAQVGGFARSLLPGMGTYEENRASIQKGIDKAYADNPLTSGAAGLAGNAIGLGAGGFVGSLAKGGGAALAAIPAIAARVAGSKAGKIGLGLGAAALSQAIPNGAETPSAKPAAAALEAAGGTKAPQKMFYAPDVMKAQKQYEAQAKLLSGLGRDDFNKIIAAKALQKQMSPKDQRIQALSQALDAQFAAVADKYAPGTPEYQRAMDSWVQNNLAIVSPQGVPYYDGGE